MARSQFAMGAVLIILIIIKNTNLFFLQESFGNPA